MTIETTHFFPSPLEKIYIAELVKVAGFCYERGWTYGTAGNFSLRGSNGLLWQSPSGECKGELDASRFVAIRMEAGQVVNVAARPSLEMPVHRGIYLNVEGAQCVVHAHPPALVKQSMKRNRLDFSNQEMIKAFGLKDHLENLSIRIAPNPKPDEIWEFSETIDAYLNLSSSMVVLEGHGAYVWGKTPMQALAYLEAAEFLCQTASL